MIKATKEQSKLFLTMGKRLGIKEQKRTHRGYVAKNYMQRVEMFELAEFSKALVNMTPQSQGIPVREHGEIVRYI